MTWLRSRWRPLAVLMAAVGLLVASIGWTAGGGTGWAGTGWAGTSWIPNGTPMMGPGRMGPVGAIAGDGPVGDLEDAGQAAGRLADRWGLTVGEVMQFDNGFYVELVDPSGDLATEVLVDPRTGTVQIEFGPAMMWNTSYGMHPALAAATTVGPGQARAIADDWLRDNRPGEHAGEAEAFPGYYTLHILHGDQITGMLSVNASNGAVWFHSWHGRLIAMTEPPGTD